MVQDTVVEEVIDAGIKLCGRVTSCTVVAYHVAMPSLFKIFHSYLWRAHATLGSPKGAGWPRTYQRYRVEITDKQEKSKDQLSPRL